MAKATTTKATKVPAAKRAPQQNNNTPNSNEAAGEVRGTAQPGTAGNEADAANLTQQPGSSHVQGPDNTALNSSSTPVAATPSSSDERPGPDKGPATVGDAMQPGTPGTEAAGEMAAGIAVANRLIEVMESIGKNGLAATIDLLAANNQPRNQLLRSPERLQRIIERYGQIYPDATHLLVTTDAQFFLPANAADAKAHQLLVDKDKEVLMLPLQTTPTEA